MSEEHKQPVTNRNALNTKSPENVNSKKVIYNGAKIREALEAVVDCAYEGLDGRLHARVEHEVLAMCRAALAEPMRNCDVGTEGEQSSRFDKFCFANRTYERGCGDCPLFSSVCCELAWSQMPYEGGGAE